MSWELICPPNYIFSHIKYVSGNHFPGVTLHEIALDSEMFMEELSWNYHPGKPHFSHIITAKIGTWTCLTKGSEIAFREGPVTESALSWDRPAPRTSLVRRADSETDPLNRVISESCLRRLEPRSRSQDPGFPLENTKSPPPQKSPKITQKLQFGPPRARPENYRKITKKCNFLLINC